MQGAYIGLSCCLLNAVTANAVSAADTTPTVQYLRAASEAGEAPRPTGEETLFDMSIAEILGVTVTVATKTEERASAAPSSVTVFTHADIRRLGVTTLQELLNYVPGFQTLRDVEQGVADRIATRGYSTALSQSVLFLINGERLNDLYTGGISILHRHIAVENIKQVEVIRGPGSSLYGSNAFLGVVNITTFDSANYLWTVFGNHDARGGSATFSFEREEVHVSGSARAYSDNGFAYRNEVDRWGITSTEHDPYSSLDLMARLSFKGLSVQARHTQEHLQGMLSFGSAQDSESQENTKQSGISATYELKLSDSLQLSFGGGWSQAQWRSVVTAIGRGVDLGGLVFDVPLRAGPFMEAYGNQLEWTTRAARQQPSAPRRTPRPRRSALGTGACHQLATNNADPQLS